MKYILCRAGGVGASTKNSMTLLSFSYAHSNINKPNKRKNTHKHSLPPGLCGDNLLIS